MVFHCSLLFEHVPSLKSEGDTTSAPPKRRQLSLSYISKLKLGEGGVGFIFISFQVLLLLPSLTGGLPSVVEA